MVVSFNFIKCWCCVLNSCCTYLSENCFKRKKEIYVFNVFISEDQISNFFTQKNGAISKIMYY